MTMVFLKDRSVTAAWCAAGVVGYLILWLGGSG